MKHQASNLKPQGNFKIQPSRGPGAHGAFDPSWLTCDEPESAEPLSRAREGKIEMQGHGGVLQA